MKTSFALIVVLNLFCLAGAMPASAGQPAKAGEVQEQFASGEQLLAQAGSSTGREKIQKAHEAIVCLFYAATNHHAGACADLSKAWQHGIGVQTNLATAYAWLLMAAQLNPAFKPDLDRLVVQLNPGDISQAQNHVSEWQHGRWPFEISKPVEFEDPRLKVQGITLGGTGSLVVVNGSTFAQGDTNEIRPANVQRSPNAPRLTTTCVEIGSDYVLVAVAGEPNLKLLSTDHFGRF